MHLLEKFTHCPVCGSAQFVESSLKSKHCRSCGFEYFLNPSAAVAAIILNEKEELLVVKRNSEPARGTLDLPGGFCDTNETLGQAVGREVKEETGLTVNRVEFLFLYRTLIVTVVSTSRRSTRSSYVLLKVSLRYGPPMMLPMLVGFHLTKSIHCSLVCNLFGKPSLFL